MAIKKKPFQDLSSTKARDIFSVFYFFIVILALISIIIVSSGCQSRLTNDLNGSNNPNSDKSHLLEGTNQSPADISNHSISADNQSRSSASTDSMFEHSLFVNNQAVSIISIKTDNLSYSSYQTIQVTANIKSEYDLSEVKLKLWGIIPYTHKYINQDKVVTLEEGMNTFIFTPRAPSCTSGCGGVNPGPYNLFFEIYFDDQLITQANTSIELVR